MERKYERKRKIFENKWTSIGIVVLIMYSGLLLYSLVCYFQERGENGNKQGDCGRIVVSEPSALVLNGTEAPLGSVPWFVAIKKREDKRPFCGASIISENWIITAKHCVKCGIVGNVSCLIIVAGAQHALDTTDATIHKIVEVRVYDSYSETTDHDIALAKISPKFKFRSNNLKGNKRGIAPICLPQYEATVTETDLTVSGFGYTSEFHFIQPEKLMTAQIHLMSLSVCQFLHKKSNETESISEMIYLCAGIVDERKGACRGDSGGPLTAVRSNAVTLVGVTSRLPATGCEKFTFYMNVAFYMQWISTSIGV